MSVGRRLADATGGGEVRALIAGPPGVAAKAGAQPLRADVVTLWASALATFAREAIATTLPRVQTDTADRHRPLRTGRDLGPRLAAKLDAPIVSDIVDVESSGDVLTGSIRAMRTRSS